MGMPWHLICCTAVKVCWVLLQLCRACCVQVPVPRALCLCQNDAVVGTPFYVMSFVQGRVFDDLSLPELAPAQRTQVC